MHEVNYFTDGSIVYPHNNIKNTKKGSFGYIALSSDYLITDSYVAYSYPDIHYLETLAIKQCLKRILKINKKNHKYTIFSDSDSAYYTIKNLVLTDKYLNPELDLLNQECSEIVDLLTDMTSTIDIHLILIKSHTYPKTQAKYLKKQRLNFTEQECKLICKGNYLVDQLVSNTARFIKAYSSLPNIKVIRESLRD